MVTKMLNFGGYEMPAEYVLVALYRYARVQGMGIMQSKDGDLPVAEARAMLDAVAFRQTLYVDYLNGRVMKVDFKDPLDFALYVRDNGQEAVNSAQLYALELLTGPTAERW